MAQKQKVKPLQTLNKSQILFFYLKGTTFGAKNQTAFSPH